jgi:polyisoprenoid-binding protein YceI
MNFSNANCGTTPCLALRKLAALLLASAALSAGTAGTAAAATYQIIQLPRSPGSEWGHANGMNEAGVIVGPLVTEYAR